MEKEQTNKEDKTIPKEGTAVGVWIIRKSKSYCGHNYYFNTLTGEAVWNLSDQEAALAKNASNAPKIENHTEPKDKPPMDSRFAYNVQLINNQKSADISAYNNQLISNSGSPPISTLICPQTGLQPPIAAINSLNLINTQPNLNPNVWNLRPPILILPTINPYNPPQQSINIAYDLQRTNNVPHRGSMFKNRRGKKTRFGSNRMEKTHNRYQTKPNNSDLRRRISYVHNKNDANTSKFIRGFKNRDLYTQNKDITEDSNDYEPVAHEQNDDISISKIDCAPLKNLSESTVNKDCWYLVVDANILLHNFNYLLNLTSTDPTCCFLVPNCVLNELQSYADEGKVVTARRVLRFLLDYAYIGSEDIEDGNETDIWSKIYNACAYIEKDNYHVVLVSDDKNLLKYKNSIYVFSMAEVKMMVSNHGSYQKNVVSSNSSHDRGYKRNDTNVFDRKMNSNPFANLTSNKTLHNINKTQSLSDLQQFDNSTSKSSTTHKKSELNKKICLLQSNDNICIRIDNRQPENVDTESNRSEEAVKGNIMEKDNFSNTKELAQKIEQDPLHSRSLKIRKLNRNDSFSSATKIETPITENKKFRWRKRRNFSSEITNCSTITSNQSKGLTVTDDRINEKSEDKKDISDNAETKNKNYDNDESNSSCIFVKKTANDCVFIDETSSSGVVSNTGSNVDLVNLPNMNLKTPKLLRSVSSTSKYLHIYEVTSQAMEESLNVRGDEWLPRFVQIMEDVLANILRQLENVALPAPWNLQEAVQCIIKEYYRNCYVVDAANKLFIYSNKVLAQSLTYICPTEFMEMYSYGFYLLNALKEFHEDSEDLKNGLKSLEDLLRDIENPNLECSQNDNFLDEAAQTEGQTVSTKTVSLEQNAQHNRKIEIESPPIPKEESVTSRKLKSSAVEDTSVRSVKIKDDVMVTFISNFTPEDSSLNEQNILESNEDSGKVEELKEHDVVDGVIDKENSSNTEPKIVRCFVKCPEFEERFQSSCKSSKDAYSEVLYDDDGYTMDDEGGDLYGLQEMPSCTYITNADKVQVDLFLKTLLTNIKNELSRALEFCKNCTYSKNPTHLSLNNKLKTKAEKLNNEITKIYQLLQNILNRENGNKNLNHLLKSEGIDYNVPLEDYKNIIMKTKDNARIILKALEHI